MSTLSPETIQARLGRFTGSEIHKLMGIKGLGKTGETYIYDKAAELLTGERARPEISAPALEWGEKHEMEAQIYFQMASGLVVNKIDTVDNGIIAGTPDGIIEGQRCGIEIKCPYAITNHLKNLGMAGQDDLKALRPEYYWQIFAYMWLMEYPAWKFCSYDPRYKDDQRMLIMNIENIDSDMGLLKSRVNEATEIFNSITSNYLKQ